ncbi:hypothetical protein KL86DES1_10745 [uncultured Desulfovibrio sp.]|uniref:Uncharacterized protein n=1 Tax=uncultured Desulfovibrio sp. TaxID=167968 RepID=A0A212L0A7_9BACT|nr:hypothetical protein KL86DES1_10745 [uncultured Desulfovibrio sp.]VZH32619.1 conserved protein of unknown function [Desulfovibrio sp. 86]
MSVARIFVNNGAIYSVAQGAIRASTSRLQHKYMLCQIDGVATAQKTGAPEMSGTPIKARDILFQAEEEGDSPLFIRHDSPAPL